ncbi:MAG: hypothetical protein JWQ50_2556 [Caballeronia mineralivorans]|nr:hypothetical protein [Caballeronia mineralivorans]
MPSVKNRTAPVDGGIAATSRTSSVGVTMTATDGSAAPKQQEAHVTQWAPPWWRKPSWGC